MISRYEQIEREQETIIKDLSQKFAASEQK